MSINNQAKGLKLSRAQVSAMTPEQLNALKAAGLEVTVPRERETLQKVGNVSYDIAHGDKGNFCVYGFNAKFPVSFYVNQYEAFKRLMPLIEAWLARPENAAKLSRE
jgi:hypothetical protein